MSELIAKLSGGQVFVLLLVAVIAAGVVLNGVTRIFRHGDQRWADSDTEPENRADADG